MLLCFNRNLLSVDTSWNKLFSVKTIGIVVSFKKENMSCFTNGVSIQVIRTIFLIILERSKIRDAVLRFLYAGCTRLAMLIQAEYQYYLFGLPPLSNE